MTILADYWNFFQVSLFPHLEKVLDEPLTDKLRQFIQVIDLIQIERFIDSPYQQTMGRTRADRRAIARAFIAKAVYDMPTTEILIDRLKLRLVLEGSADLNAGVTFQALQPSRPYGSVGRAFAEFARLNIGDHIHEALVRTHVGDKIVMSYASVWTCQSRCYRSSCTGEACYERDTAS